MKFKNGASSFVYKYNNHCTYFSEELVNDFIKCKRVSKCKDRVNSKLFCKLFIDMLNKSYFMLPDFSAVKCITNCQLHILAFVFSV